MTNTYRSEMQIPINKSNKLNGELQESTTKSYVVNPNITEWSDKVKISNKQKDLTLSQHENNLTENNQVLTNEFDRLRSIEIFKQLYTTIGQADDGLMHFRATFDVKEADPNSLSVFVKDGFITLTCVNDSKAQAKFSRRFNLPPRIDPDTLQCAIDSEGHLTLDACLDDEINSSGGRSASFSSNTSTLSSPASSPTLVIPSSTQFSQSLNNLQFPFQKSRQSTFNTNNTSTTTTPTSPNNNPVTSTSDDLYSLNIQIGVNYLPEHISIKTHDNKLYIGARCEERSGLRTNYREFSKEITLPNSVDPLSISATFLSDGILHIEAPYKF